MKRFLDAWKVILSVDFTNLLLHVVLRVLRPRRNSVECASFDSLLSRAGLGKGVLFVTPTLEDLG